MKKATVSDLTPRKRLTWNEQRELEQLPRRIDALGTEEQQLEATIAGPEFYKEPRTTIEAALKRLDEVKCELIAAYARWDDLDSRGQFPGSGLK